MAGARYEQADYRSDAVIDETVARDSMAREVAERVQRGRVFAARELLEGGVGGAVEVRVGADGLRVEGNYIAYGNVRQIAAAGMQVAVQVAQGNDCLWEFASDEEVGRLCAAVPAAYPVMQLAPGDTLSEALQLAPLHPGRAGSPGARSDDASSASSGVHLVPKACQRRDDSSLRMRGGASEAGGAWTPFHHVHATAATRISATHAGRLSSDSRRPAPSAPSTEGTVALRGKLTLSHTSYAMYADAPGFAQQRLHDAAVRDIAQSLGVPADWVTVTLKPAGGA